MKVSGQDDGEVKCIVQVLCEGNEINATARAYWKSSQTENNIDSTGPSAVNPASLPYDSAVEDTTTPQCQSEAEEPEHHTMEDLERDVTPIDDQDSGPDNDGLEVTPASLELDLDSGE